VAGSLAAWRIGRHQACRPPPAGVEFISFMKRLPLPEAQQEALSMVGWAGLRRPGLLPWCVADCTVEVLRLCKAAAAAAAGAASGAAPAACWGGACGGAAGPPALGPGNQESVALAAPSCHRRHTAPHASPLTHPPTRQALAQYHYLLLYPGRLQLVNTVSGKVVQEVAAGGAYAAEPLAAAGAPLSLLVDDSGGQSLLVGGWAAGCPARTAECRECWCIALRVAGGCWLRVLAERLALPPPRTCRCALTVCWRPH
jgi:hypothetical protein